MCAPQWVQGSPFCRAQLQSELRVGRHCTVCRTGQRLNIYSKDITQNYEKGVCANCILYTHRKLYVQGKAGDHIRGHYRSGGWDGAILVFGSALNAREVIHARGGSFPGCVCSCLVCVLGETPQFCFPGDRTTLPRGPFWGARRWCEGWKESLELTDAE